MRQYIEMYASQISPEFFDLASLSYNELYKHYGVILHREHYKLSEQLFVP